ncbi:MAG: multiheme c-type cytochrome [Planctomycetota bacterium]
MSFSSVLGEEKKCTTLDSKEGYESSRNCRICHPTQYATWSNSMHAKTAVESAFSGLIPGTPKKTLESCMGCHAPTFLVTGDNDFKDEITREGITCDFCHTVTGVVPGRTRNEFEIQVGSKKFGPIKDPESEGDRSFSFSSLHTKSWFCAGCHQLTSENGTPILNTYAEWSESPYAERGVRCQDCHMYSATDLPVVPSHIRKTANRATRHDFMGGHSPLKREKAVTIAVHAQPTEDGHVRARVTLVNRESGHKVPTGLPTRKLVLKVNLLDKRGKVCQTRTKVYQRLLVDKEGLEVRYAKNVFTGQVTVKSDNRLPPLEPVVETFDFADPVRHWAVEAVLEYEMNSEVPGRGRTTFVMAKGRFQPPGGFPSVYILSFVFLGILVLGGVAYAFLTELSARKKSSTGQSLQDSR